MACAVVVVVVVVVVLVVVDDVDVVEVVEMEHVWVLQFLNSVDLPWHSLPSPIFS